VVPPGPEKKKRPGVCYAITDDGVELPVVDVTNPLFTETASQKELIALERDFLRFQKMPLFLRRFLARRSITMRGMRSTSEGFLGGMTTYVAKLPAEVLGKGYSGFMDRKVAQGIGAVSFRMRLQAMARAIADELAPLLAGRGSAPVHLVNIGGGPAMDSLNAAILVKRERADLLRGRQVFVHVLDVDEAGPRFGARALAALTSEGRPLGGLDIVLTHVPYDWTKPFDLDSELARITGDSVVICSSEGGLFEYGPDDVIAQNLKTLWKISPPISAVVGSIVRNNRMCEVLRKMSTLSFRTFEAVDFRVLAESVGWVVGQVIENNPMYSIVCLRKG
jgi:hypothetical protein